MKPYTTKKKKQSGGGGGKNQKNQSVKDLPNPPPNQIKYFISKNTPQKQNFEPKKQQIQNTNDVLGCLQSMTDKFQQRMQQMIENQGERMKQKLDNLNKQESPVRNQELNLQNYAQDMNKHIVNQVFIYQEKNNSSFAQYVTQIRDEQRKIREPDQQNIEKLINQINDMSKTDDQESHKSASTTFKQIKQKLDQLDKNVDSIIAQ